jgi:Alr-MurF fusion protein
MYYTAAQVAQIFDLENIAFYAYPIEHIAYDSRKIIFPEKTLFFALHGRLDGHAYLQDAYLQGVRNFVVKKGLEAQHFPEANLFWVENPLTALQDLAREYRSKFTLPVIGITGSNGKTIVKDWLSQLIDNEYCIIKSPRSYNSQLGVALSVLGIEERHALGVFEAGISKPDEMERLAKIIQPSIGIFTNIGDAHNEGFENVTEKIKEKIKLFTHCKKIICEEKMLPYFEKKELQTRFFTWEIDSTSTSPKEKKADLTVFNIVQNAYQHTQINAFFQSKNIQITIPFSDYPSIENAISCWATMLCMEYPQELIMPRMAKLQPIALRMDIKAGVNNCQIINDSYSLDLTSLAYSLDFLNQQAKGKKTLILSDIFQSGLEDSQLFSQIQLLIESKNINRIILIGEKKYPIFSKKIKQQQFSSTSDCLAQLKWNDFQNETILLKGARVFAFEQIAEFLAQKAHRTVLEINLDALRHNLGVYSRQLRPKVKTLVMVKASAYGSGSAEVAKLLEYQQVDYLGVAYSDEGVTLRKEGIKLPILVLNPEEASFAALLRYDLEPEIYCISQLKSLLPFIKNESKTLRIHLKLDTGMHRLGFEKEDITALTTILKAHKILLVQSIFSHLAGSEAAEHDDFTHQQATLFMVMYAQITEVIGYKPMRHLCNTGAIVRFPQYHFEMVRLGIGIYGMDSSAALQKDLQVVSTLKARISQIKFIPQGESVGYSRKGLAYKDLRIATIGIGYADGLLRAAGNGRFSVAIHGQLAPIIGNVCMDMTMIDITDLQGVQEGDEVIVFGDFPKVESLATATQTIAYEVFTNISERVKRIYFRE